jgi:hypothetical protein
VSSWNSVAAKLEEPPFGTAWGWSMAPAIGELLGGVVNEGEDRPHNWQLRITGTELRAQGLKRRTTPGSPGTKERTNK